VKEAELSDHIRRWRALGEAGLIVSVVLGPMGGSGRLLFSVDVLTVTFESFPRPYAAETFEQAIEIAEKESRKRGWFK
jgi:hypothetical protein